MATTPDTSVAARAKYEPVIGLEVHVQLLTVTKIFCSCSTRFGDSAQYQCLPGVPGTSRGSAGAERKAVDFAVLAAMALGCRINETSIFARKNYFYPDLPKGYQISQYDKPLAEFGGIEIATAAGTKKDRHHPPAPRRRRGQEPARRLCRFRGDYGHRPEPQWSAADRNRQRARISLRPPRRTNISPG